jgi:hypothetical protein
MEQYPLYSVDPQIGGTPFRSYKKNSLSCSPHALLYVPADDLGVVVGPEGPGVRQAISAGSHGDDTIRGLELEIASIEKELRDVECRIRTLQSEIQARYHHEIVLIRELASVYKKKKLAKKEKRLEQKKRGKNYQPPQGLKKSKNTTGVTSALESSDTQELKRLYREAVLQVHPDKFVNHTDEISKRSQDLTIELIDTYQSGDLEELKAIYHHIMSGNAMSSDQSDKKSVPDPKAMHSYLIKKRNDLITELNEVKQSRIFEVLSTYDDPKKFIDELAVQLLIRIRQLERRTRVNKK